MFCFFLGLKCVQVAILLGENHLKHITNTCVRHNISLHLASCIENFKTPEFSFFKSISLLLRPQDGVSELSENQEVWVLIPFLLVTIYG